MKNHNEILSSGGIDNHSNYIGKILSDNFVNVIGRHRDSDCLAQSNFQVALEMLGGESEDVQIHSFNHWAVGWIEEVFVNSENKEILAIAEEIRDRLENYPILDEDHFGEMERDKADEIWKNCYNEQERIDYIRDRRDQFYFHDMEDLMGCVRGKYFAGYSSDLIG